MTAQLYTEDEARNAFTHSALNVMAHLTGPDALAVSAIHGSVPATALPHRARHAAIQHQALIDQLEILEYRWIIDDELDGLTSCIQAVGCQEAGNIIGGALYQQAA